MDVNQAVDDFNRRLDEKEKKYAPFEFIEKNEVIDEPKDLYVLSYRFTMPITRSSYRKEKTDELHLDAVNQPGESVYTSGLDLNKCVEGAYLLECFAKAVELESKHGMHHANYDYDIDYYTVEWSFNRSDSDSYWTRSYVQCEHSWDVNQENPKELQDTKVNFVVSIANESKELCYQELKEIYKKTLAFAKDTLNDEKDLVFNKDVNDMLKQAENLLDINKNKDKVSLKQVTRGHKKPMDMEM